MTTSNQDEISQAVWEAYTSYKGKVDSEYYKYTILALLFFKAISDDCKGRYHEYLIKYNGEVERAQRAMRYERFVLDDATTFDYLYHRREIESVGELIDNTLLNFAETNKEKFSSIYGSSIFSCLSFNDDTTLSRTIRRKKLRDLLTTFGNSRLSFEKLKLGRDDIVSSVYDSIIRKFSEDVTTSKKYVYTPDEVSTLVAKLVSPRPKDFIYDPYCGTGGLLIRTAKESQSKDVFLYGEEADRRVCAIALMNILLNGYDNLLIHCGDATISPKFEKEGTLMKFDVVVTRPPFGISGDWGITDAVNDPYNRFWRGIPPKGKGDWAFISHAVETIKKDSGRACVISPSGVLFRKGIDSKIRKHVINQNVLEAVIALPSSVFSFRGTSFVVLLFSFRKNENTDVLFIDGRGKFYDRSKIIKIYKRFISQDLKMSDVDSDWICIASRKKIMDMSCSLSVEHYVVNKKVPTKINIEKAYKEIDTIEKEINIISNDINRQLNVLES